MTLLFRVLRAFKASFPVVAVGASAGGLEAFRQLLSTLPNNTGMAFVFIQHLDPKHHSLLSELLAKTCSMPVVEAKNETKVEPNHVYVIPPNVNMGILRRRFQLTPRKDEPGQYCPIDFFMRSLAEARNSHPIGVVLSGTASDGTRGLSAIKAEGGITFSQDERSAKYNGMPHSAIASGCVDFILPPEKIGKELARISGHSYLRHEVVGSRNAGVKKPKRRNEHFDRIFALLRKTCGINFRGYKTATIQRRTLRRMALHKIEHVSDYMTYLEKHPSETETLCQDFLIPVTSFFRDLEAFETLKDKVFPAILKDKTNKGNIRIWAPGCSTGEETYSLAIVLLEFLGDRASSFQVQLFGTDVNERGIEKARAGIYQERISQEIMPERLRRFFVKADEGYRVTKGVRDLCVFAKHNLSEDPPFSHMNLVACRNLLIYLGPELQSKVMPILHYALRPSGFLMLGQAESVAAFPDLFDPADKKHKIFAKRAVGTRLHYDFSANLYPRETSIPIEAREQNGISMDLDRQNEADRIVLKKYAPPGVVINENMEVLQFRGAIGPYIEPAPGRASLHLLKIAKKEFVAELRTAVNRAKKNHAQVKRRSVEFRRNGQLKSVNFSVEPLESSNESRQYLILFERTSLPASPHGKVTGKLRGIGRTAKGEIAQIRRKLATAEEHLRSIIESKEASDEEYQSANEEVLSANEELQSTNEELETSKEELQSANEELNTVNDELHNRNIDLDRVNSDLNNVLASTSMPVVVVDRGLRIRRLTTASAKVLKILPSDIGRPIMDIRSDINLPNLGELIAGVIETLSPKELEVQDHQGHWYSLNIRPYRTTDDKIDGAVLVLSDIDPLKRLNERLLKAKEFTEDIIDTVREPLAVLAKDLKVLYVNPSFLKTFEVNRSDAEGKPLDRLGNGQWNIPNLLAALEAVISKDTPLSDFEVERDFPDLGTKIMLLNARRIIDGHSDESMMLLAIEDITERRRNDEALRESEGKYRTLFDSIDEGFCIIEKVEGEPLDFRYVEANPAFAPQSGASSVVGKTVRQAFPGEPEEWFETYDAILKTGESKRFERVLVTHGRTLELYAFRVEDKTHRRVAVIFKDITERKETEQALRETHDRLESLVEHRTAAVRKLSSEIIRSQDEERRRIARELHDSVGQYIAHAKMSLEGLQKPGATKKQAKALGHITDTLDKCLTETRTISYLLHPPLLDEIGFASAARWYVEGFSERSGIQVNFAIPREMKRLPGTVELILFRILQESLTNVHRHAQTRSVDVHVQVDASEIALEVRDHGKGMPPELLERFRATGAGVGIGLNSMRERISEISGRLEIQSDTSGTTIRVALPLTVASEKTATDD
ncbi:MAG TPA: chemotaxis protein CheB [Candidatus Acidoferrales bacterium]|nr:chemotaxis protein CheB [Candidatus Acidoferrales bacterium]